jgi:hypothetical protein
MLLNLILTFAGILLLEKSGLKRLLLKKEIARHAPRTPGPSFQQRNEHDVYPHFSKEMSMIQKQKNNHF